jgi:hypothetical protein
MRRFKLTDFTYSKTTLTTEASSLRLPPCQSLTRFEVQSHITGVVIPFEFRRVERDRDMDVVCWEYASVGEYPTLFTARVYND